MRASTNLQPILLALLVLSAAACDQPAPEDDTNAAAAAAADSMRTALQYAFVNKDAVAIAEMYAEDGVLVEADGTVHNGRSAIERRIAELLPRLEAYTIASHLVAPSGGLAFDRQDYQVTLVAAEGSEPPIVSGTQLVVIGRQPDGRWKIVQSGTWLAAPGAAEATHH